MKQLDWKATEERARRMSVAELFYAVADCTAAGDAAQELEQAGNRVDKTQGYYHDERSVYLAEIKKREVLL